MQVISLDIYVRDNVNTEEVLSLLNDDKVFDYDVHDTYDAPDEKFE